MDAVVVGCGAAAERYLATHDGSAITVVATCDTDADRATALATSLGAEPFADIDAMLEATVAPLVLNLTSHGAHATVTRRCLAADRHVWSEKPLALDADTAFDLVSLAADRGRGLGCAPITPRGPAQRQVEALVADGRLGTVRLAYAHAHVGRVTDWHDDPSSFLEAGPLMDGAVYPLTALVDWFGPVETVRSADAARIWPADDPHRPTRPTHVEATLEFAAGPLLRLTASFYAPHRSREFTSLELHGDDGSTYLADAGDMGSGTDHLVSFARQGREYTTVPVTARGTGLAYLAGPERLARSVRGGSPTRRTARRAAHVVDICTTITAATEDGAPRAVRSTVDFEPPVGPVYRPTFPRSDAAVRLPPVGFGCSRYRDGEYVDRRDSIETAIDAGYRFFDSAELYGNEHVIGDLLEARGSPVRRSVFLASKVWNTNHAHVAEACETTLQDLGVEALDCYLLHWPDAWAYTGPLRRLAELPPAEQEARTFPRDEDGEIRQADVSLEAVWRDLEGLVERGRVRTLGLCNVDRDILARVLEFAIVPPAIVQVERHPYHPRTDLVDFCHERGIRVVAHTPLGTDGLLSDPKLADLAAEIGVTVPQVVLAWNVAQGVVPIPSSTDRDHVVDHLTAATIRLSADQIARIDSLADTDSRPDVEAGE